MSIQDIEAEALKLSPQGRARLARRLMESLEEVSGEEPPIWAEEAQHRDAEWDDLEGRGRRHARDVLRDARARLK